MTERWQVVRARDGQVVVRGLRRRPIAEAVAQALAHGHPHEDYTIEEEQ